MIRDVAAKLLFIPLIGLGISLFTHLLPYAENTLTDVVLFNFFCITVTFLLWQAVVAITALIRNNAHISKHQLPKILSLIFSAAFLAILISHFALLAWNKIVSNHITGNTLSYTIAFVAIAPLISLSYESLFLKKEQELDAKIVDQLDHERQYTELNILKNSLDPHFIFNALNTLAPLIATDTTKAQTFTTKLAQALKYFLLNKDRELITLTEELRFIEDYFFLLRIRYGHKLILNIDMHEKALNKIMVLPFALQVLVENAIKHNQFSEDHPLTINISLTKESVQVNNTIQAKTYDVESTNVGLKNLSARYKLTCNHDIIITQTEDTFSVNLPIIKTTV